MADKKQTKVYLIPEGETRDSHTYHYTAIKTRKFTLENKKMTKYPLWDGVDKGNFSISTIR